MTENELLLSTSYFPPISYFWLMHKYKAFIEVNENFQKRSIRNRAQVSGANGKLVFSVPLCKGKSRLPITKVTISYDEPWPSHHLSIIQSAYGSAPYFDYYFPQVERILKSRKKYLLDLNFEILDFLGSLGYAPLHVRRTTSYCQATDVKGLDLRKYSGKEIPINPPAYDQVFEYKYGFIPDLSILDLLFNLGPEGQGYLRSIRS